MILGFFDRRRDAARERAIAEEEMQRRENAIRVANDILKIFPDLCSSTTYTIIQKYGEGDDQQARRKLSELASKLEGGDELEKIVFMIFDVISSSKSKVVVDYKFGPSVTFDKDTMDSYQIVKNGEICKVVCPPVFAEYDVPYSQTMERKRILIRNAIVEPIELHE